MPLLDATTLDDVRAALAQARTPEQVRVAQLALQAADAAKMGDTGRARDLLNDALPAAADPRLLFLGFQFFFRTAVADGSPPDDRARWLATAERLVRRRLDIVQDAGDTPAAARAHTNLGLVLHYQGRREEAHAHYTRAVELALVSGNRRELARSRGNLANFYESRDTPPAPHDLAAAEALYSNAIADALAASEPDIQAGLTSNLADIHAARGETAAARTLWRSALALMTDRDHKARAHCLARLDETSADGPPALT